jgi:hypothetical protein
MDQLFALRHVYTGMKIPRTSALRDLCTVSAKDVIGVPRFHEEEPGDPQAQASRGHYAAQRDRSSHPVSVKFGLERISCLSPST